MGQALKKKTVDTFLTIRILNGFLPCELVYIALFAAIAMGDIAEGILYMVLFGLGTIPLMTTAVYFSGFLKGNSKKRIQKLIPAFVVVMGILYILRGLGLGIPYVSQSPVLDIVSSQIDFHP